MPKVPPCRRPPVAAPPAVLARPPCSTRVFTTVLPETASAWAALRTHMFTDIRNERLKHCDPSCAESDYAPVRTLRAYAKGQEPAGSTQCPACHGGAGSCIPRGACMVLTLETPLQLPPGMQLVSLAWRRRDAVHLVHDAQPGVCAAGTRNAYLVFADAASGFTRESCRCCASWRVAMQAVEATRLPFVLKSLIYAWLQ